MSIINGGTGSVENAAAENYYDESSVIKRLLIAILECTQNARDQSQEDQFGHNCKQSNVRQSPEKGNEETKATG